ncbi:MAG: fatty acid desaturase [Labilithrix sp.]|nr:fatty acid desaturase [Labilithrix sp.]MCW5809434.1 fatty acid desaturase [Labilithrix sp.]
MGLLRYSADRRTLAIVGSWFVVEAALWSIDGHPWLTAGLFSAACVGAFLAAVATHNTIHCPVFHSRTLEALWKCVLTLAYGHPIGSFVPGHNLSHHRHLETRADVMRTSKARARWNLINIVTFFPSISGAMLRSEIGYVRFAWRRRARWRRQLVLESCVLVVAALALAAVDYKRLLWCVVIPHVYAAWGVVTMNLLQHDGADTDSPHNHSRSFIGKTVNWLTFNNGFHAVHHLRPGLHWSLLPAAHERLVVPHTDPRLIEPSLPAYLFRTYVFPGRRVRFDGRPVVLVEAGADAPWYGKYAPATAQTEGSSS